MKTRTITNSRRAEAIIKIFVKPDFSHTSHKTKRYNTTPTEQRRNPMKKILATIIASLLLTSCAVTITTTPTYPHEETQTIIPLQGVWYGSIQENNVELGMLTVDYTNELWRYCLTHENYCTRGTTNGAWLKEGQQIKFHATYDQTTDTLFVIRNYRNEINGILTRIY